MALFYSPDFEGHLGEALDIHPKQQLVVGDRRADIDNAIYPLVAALWERGFDTITSCQSTEAPTEPRGYVVFATADSGGRRFFEALRVAGLTCEERSGPVEIPLGDPPFAKIVVESYAVLFRPEQIPQVTAVAQAM